MPLTIDASVFISSARYEELHHIESLRFVANLSLSAETIICPCLVLPECAAAVARRSAGTDLASRLILNIQSVSLMKLIPLDITRAQQSGILAASLRLRGADAVYVAVAKEFGSTLITWDKEMLERGVLAVPTMTPTDWLLAHPIG